MMNDGIELLDIDLLEEKNILKEIDHWLKVFNWINGWHYDLDIIWIVKQLESNGILPGATILDTGAGYGMTQFILASRGYNVISMDFTKRNLPEKAKGIFDIEIIKNDLGSYTSEYMEYMTYGKSSNGLINTLKSVPKALLHPIKIIKFIKKMEQKISSYFINYTEKKQDHTKFGKIEFIRGTFNDIPLDDGTIDALISISAFEHNIYEDMPSSVNEFNRILKDKGVMFVTTSAAKNKDWYQESSKGWNFTKKTLSDWFNITDKNISFDYDTEHDRIRNSKMLSNRLEDYYKDKSNLTIPNGDLKNIEYIPVGIRKYKYYENDKQ
ncbi:class I SAM-dependent methyltransferase [Methanococcoides burtonii]|nr:methyltransferase domain-containing protein [Methanococcoides burtonii]